MVLWTLLREVGVLLRTLLCDDGVLRDTVLRTLLCEDGVLRDTVLQTLL